MGGLFFDGADDYVTFGAAPGLCASNFTLETWFLWTGGGSTGNSGSGGIAAIPLITKGRGEGESATYNANYFLGIQPNGLLAADFEEGPGGGQLGLNHPVVGITPVSPGEWHHAAVTYDGASWALYLDGNLETNHYVGQPAGWDSIQHAALGSALNSTGVREGAFSGVLDEVRIWNHARNASQIATNRILQIVSAPGLVGRWPLDETMDVTAYDTSGSSINGSLVFGPVWTNGYPFAVRPVVSLTAPTNDARFVSPATLLVEAAASDADGTVTRVEFFQDGSKLGEAVASPFQHGWSNVAQGYYDLTAIATDNSGLTSTSAPVRIAVENQVLRLAAPPKGASFVYPDSIAIIADILDTNAAVLSVEFFDGTEQVGRADSEPFGAVWVGAGLGSHALSAVATAAGGIRNTSLPISITVISNQAPTVTITAPANNASIYLPDSLAISVAALDSDGGVTNVEFYAGEVRLGVDASLPYSFVWDTPPLGLQSLKAVAWDNRGLTATSSVVTVYVLASTAPSVLAFAPMPGLATNLSSVTVRFTEPVVGVDASDLLVNGSPATNATGDGVNFTFSFPPPADGPVALSWASAHGIGDTEAPPKAFGGLGAQETAQYTQVDGVQPTVVRIWPMPGATLTALSQIEVTFSEPVGGIAADALLVNSTPAASVRGSGSGPYIFEFPVLSNIGVAQIAWSGTQSIHDFAAVPNPFGGGAWSYPMDWRVWGQGVLINEIMFHPSSHSPAEEYIELYNVHGVPVNVTGFRLTGGVDFTFTNLTMPASSFLIIAADQGRFRSKYPSVTNVVGNWTGTLADGGERIRLVDALGLECDSISYADQGDWATRVAVTGYSTPGWDWLSPADGLGKSLELVKTHIFRDCGQNWLPSIPANGTPGAPNSVVSAEVPPFILDLQHFPPVPRSGDSVTITARLLDEDLELLTVVLSNRVASSTTPPGFTGTLMYDDGLHSDGVAWDGVYGAILPPQPAGTIIEFFVWAQDYLGQVRTWPAAARQADGTTFAQTCNALYQVDNEANTNGMPIFRIIMTEKERQEFDPQNSDAQKNVTLVSSDGVETRVRYNCGVRVRGSGTRSRTPRNLRVDVPTDRRWNGLTEINLNTQFIHAQISGSALALRSGLPAEAVRPVQVRLNGVNRAPSGPPVSGTGSGAGFGTYAFLEPYGDEWARLHFPDDDAGNAYRAADGWGAILDYRGTAASSYAPNYVKASNRLENNWTDLINLCAALQTSTPDSVYVASVKTNLNVQEWMRYFAVCSLLEYTENGLPTGVGDDYSMYRGVKDPRFLLVPHDFDTVLGQGDTSGNIAESIWVAPDRGQMPVLVRFMKHNEFAPVYFQELKRLAETTFASAQINPLLDQLFAGWVPGTVIDNMKTFASARAANVLSQIPTNFSVSVPLSIGNGYYQTTSSSVSLSGRANALVTRTVMVGGAAATWTAWQGQWSRTVTLRPGINRIMVQAFDGNAVEVEAAAVDIWYDDGSVASVSGALATDTTWTAAGGPYLVTGTFTVPASVTLSLQPGTTVYLAPGARILVSGRLLAEGTASQRIRLTRQPGATGQWSDLRFENSAFEQRLIYVDIEHGGTGGASVLQAQNANLWMDHVTWANTSSRLLDLAASSITLLNSVLPSIQEAELVHFSGMPIAGHALFQSNLFGSTTAGYDVVRIAGGNRPGPIAQFLDNVFTSASDDVIDLVGSDAHIEGNTFLRVHQDVPRDNAAHAISTSRSGGDVSEPYLARNIFYDCDHALLLSEGASAVIENNTIVRITTNSPAAELAAVINFGEPLRGLAGGAGARMDGNIVWDVSENRLLLNYSNGMYFSADHSILPGTDHPGTGNLNLDPMFVSVDASNLAYANIRRSLSLRPGSPAIGAGPNGVDMGALVPAGPVVSGEPASPTALTSATLAVYGPGLTDYRFRLNGGQWSADRAITNPIVLSGLSNGSYTVHVLARNSAGVWTDPLKPVASRPWIVNASMRGIRLNEVLARNDNAVSAGSRHPDLIELFNAGAASADLAGMSLTDNADVPRKFVFPPGTTLGAGQFLVLYADNETSPPGLHTGFTLKQEGDDLHLFDANGRRLDSVVFGPQLADLSIGRLRDGNWALTEATLGAVNVAARTGDPRALLINEWLAAGISPVTEDFVELLNPGSLPVDLGGLYLTDVPESHPARHGIAPLSFIAPRGFAVFLADGRSEDGPLHLEFRLQAEGGLIALFNRDLGLIDCVLYGAQTNNVSQGRSPDGSSRLAYFATPTPGAPNPFVLLPVGSHVVLNEVLAKNVSVADAGGGTREWIELFNPTTNSIDLGDMSLSDSTLDARRYVFPPGTMLGPLGWHVMYCEGDQPVSATNTGFGIKANGGTVYLFDKGIGGALLDGISYGVQAADFSIGRVPDGGSNWVLTLPTLGSVNIVVQQLGNPRNLKVNEWMADPTSGEDWFEIYNPDPNPVALGGLYLTDDRVGKPTQFQVAPLSFIGVDLQGFERFWADGNSTAGPEHTNFKLSRSGEDIAIFLSEVEAIDVIGYAAQGYGVSQGRLPDGAPTVALFPESPTPGDANYRPLTNVVVSEVLSHSDPPFEDAIELQNISRTAVNLRGWYVSDAIRELKKYQITNSIVIPPGGFCVLYETNFNADPLDPAFFALDSARGDQVYVSAATTNGILTGYRATAKFGPSARNVSFGRHVNSVGQVEFVAMSRRTFGVDSPETLEQFRAGAGLSNAYPLVGPIVISEIMYHPPDVDGLDNVQDEFIELYNVSLTNVALYDPAHPTNTWRLRGGVDYNFPPETVVPPDAFVLVVSFDPIGDPAAAAAFRARYGLTPGVPMVGPYTGKLDNGGESVELYKPDRPQLPGLPDAGYVPYVLVERIEYGDTAPWPVSADGAGASLQRLVATNYANEPANWIATAPAPVPQDRDADGMPDVWETAYGLNPRLNDAAADQDNDGLSNIEEYRAGTRPNDSLSTLRLQIATGASVTLRFTAMPDKAYRLEYRDSITDSGWLPLHDVEPQAFQRIEEFSDSAPSTSKFYRVRVP